MTSKVPLPAHRAFSQSYKDDLHGILLAQHLQCCPCSKSPLLHTCVILDVNFLHVRQPFGRKLQSFIAPTFSNIVGNEACHTTPNRDRGNELADSVVTAAVQPGTRVTLSKIEES